MIEQMDFYGYWLRLGKHIETANKSAECQKSWKAFEIIKLEFHSRQSRVDKAADCKSLRVGLQENDWVIQ